MCCEYFPNALSWKGEAHIEGLGDQRKGKDLNQFKRCLTFLFKQRKIQIWPTKTPQMYESSSLHRAELYRKFLDDKGTSDEMNGRRHKYMQSHRVR